LHLWKYRRGAARGGSASAHRGAVVLDVTMLIEYVFIFIFTVLIEDGLFLQCWLKRIAINRASPSSTRTSSIECS
jgi:hypothetical protein